MRTVWPPHSVGAGMQAVEELAQLGQEARLGEERSRRRSSSSTVTPGAIRLTYDLASFVRVGCRAARKRR